MYAYKKKMASFNLKGCTYDLEWTVLIS